MAKLSLEQYRLAAGIFEAMLASSKGPQASASPGRENSGDSSSAGTWNGNSKKGKGKGKESAAAAAAAGEGEGGQQEAPTATAPVISAQTADELQDSLDAIRETIDTMVSGKDMEALAEYKSGAASTTIGFGDASPSPSSLLAAGGASGSSVCPAGETTTVGFGTAGAAVATTTTTSAGFGEEVLNGALKAFSSSGIRGTTAAAGNVMVVKRKGRPASKVPGGGVAGVTPGGGDVAKKAKSAE